MHEYQQNHVKHAEFISDTPVITENELAQTVPIWM